MDTNLYLNLDLDGRVLRAAIREYSRPNAAGILLSEMAL
jgi:hypothetical protein